MSSNHTRPGTGLARQGPEMSIDHFDSGYAPSVDSHHGFPCRESMSFHGRDKSLSTDDILNSCPYPLMGPRNSYLHLSDKLTPTGSQVSDQCSVRGSDWEILKSELQNLARDHERLTSDRVSSQQSRKHLKRSRETSIDLGITLMRELKKCFTHMKRSEAGSTFPTDIFPIFEKYQIAWAEYLILEDEYSEQEDNLNDREFEIGKTQKRLKDAVEQYDTNKNSIVDLTDKNSESGLTFESGTYHPLVAKYLSRVGALELNNETFHNLELNYKQAEELHRGGSSHLDEYTVDLLQNYQTYRDEINHERKTLETELRQLHEQCNLKGLPTDQPFISYTSDSEESLSPTHEDSSGLSPDSLGSLLVCRQVRWEKESPPFFEVALPQAPIETGEFINKWLFHQLCQSSLAVFQLRQCVQDQGVKINSDEELRDLTMRFWIRDAAAKPVFRADSEALPDYPNMQDFSGYSDNTYKKSTTEKPVNCLELECTADHNRLHYDIFELPAVEIPAVDTIQAEAVTTDSMITVAEKTEVDIPDTNAESNGEPHLEAKVTENPDRSVAHATDNPPNLDHSSSKHRCSSLPSFEDRETYPILRQASSASFSFNASRHGWPT